MAGGDDAVAVPCWACGARADRTSEGIETDWYRCSKCRYTFGIDYESSGPADEPLWPPRPQMPPGVEPPPLTTADRVIARLITLSRAEPDAVSPATEIGQLSSSFTRIQQWVSALQAAFGVTLSRDALRGVDTVGGLAALIAREVDGGPTGRTMNEPTSSRAAESDALRETYAAINRNDIETAVRPFDPEIVWIEPSDYPGGGTTRGRAAVKSLLSNARSTWAEGGCEPERFVVAGDKVVVFIHVRVRPKGAMEWTDGRHASVYTFRDGRAVEMRIFDDERRALEWAGVDAS